MATSRDIELLSGILLCFFNINCAHLFSPPFLVVQVSIVFVNIINDIRFKRCWWNESSQDDLEDGQEGDSVNDLNSPLLD